MIGAVQPSGHDVVANSVKGKIDLSWIPFERFAVIIFNVTTEVIGTFDCDVWVSSIGTLTFRSTTQVDIVGKPYAAFNNYH